MPAQQTVKQPPLEQYPYPDKQPDWNQTNDIKETPKRSVDKVEKSKPEKPKFLIVKAANVKSNDNAYSMYPFGDLEIGQGFFVADDDVKFDNINYFRKEIYRARKYYSIAEHDENGDEIFEEIHTKTKQVTNGKVSLDSGGNPILGITSNLVPKLIYSRHFSVHAVNEGDDIGDGQKAPAKGVLVVREA